LLSFFLAGDIMFSSLRLSILSLESKHPSQRSTSSH
jgi:hypothetical protein